MILETAQSLGEYVIGGGVGGVGVLLLREGVPVLLKYFRKNGNGRGMKSGDLPPDVWKAEFHSLQQILDNQTEILKTAVALLGGIDKNTAILVDRSK